MLGQPFAYCLSIANASLRQALPSNAQASAIVVGLSPQTFVMSRSCWSGVPTLPTEMLDADAVVLAPAAELVDLSPQPATTPPSAAAATNVAARRRGASERRRDMAMGPPLPVVAVPATPDRAAPSRRE